MNCVNAILTNLIPTMNDSKRLDQEERKRSTLSVQGNEIVPLPPIKRSRLNFPENKLRSELHIIEQDDIVAVEKQRLRMQGLLLKRLRKHKIQDESELMQSAYAIERLLFRQSLVDDCLDAYADESSLNGRLVSLMVAVMNRRIIKLQREAKRKAALMHFLGEPKYEHIMKIVNEVVSLRLNRASVGCTGAACARRNRSFTARCAIIDLPVHMPEPVKQLFFKTAIISAVHDLPLNALDSLDWDSLIAQAEKNISAYRRWAAQSEE